MYQASPHIILDPKKSFCQKINLIMRQKYLLTCKNCKNCEKYWLLSTCLDWAGLHRLTWVITYCKCIKHPFHRA